jgi:glycosyltransferase involved in cell wall biosynthesis
MKQYYTPEIDGIRIPLGINRPEAITSKREEFGFSEDVYLYVTVGRLVARKAIDQLIGVMSRFKDKPVHLLIVGSGPQEKTLRDKASELGITPQIHFMGQVSDHDKQKILNISDAFVSTSQHEGFGIVYLEAMAAGLPVICYDYGGQTDFLENRKTGFVLPLNDTEAVFVACNTISEDRSLLQDFRKENIRRIESLYIDNCAKRYEEVFENVLT